MIRSAYALGGLGSGLCDNEEKLRDMATRVSKVLRKEATSIRTYTIHACYSFKNNI